MIKKILITSTIVFVLAGIAFFTYKYLIKNALNKKLTVISEENQLKNEEAKKKINEGKKEEENKKIKIIAEGNIKGVTISKEENKIYYFNSDNFLSIDPDGSLKKTIDSYPLGEVEYFSWSEKFNKALIKNDQGYFVYDLETKNLAKLKDGLDLVIWNPLRDQIIYKYFDKKTKKRSLNISDISGENWKEISDISFQKVDLNLKPRSELVGIYSTPDAFVVSEFKTIDLVEKSENKIFDGRRGADYLWSPNGEKLLVSHTLEGDNAKLTLGIMNSDGGEYHGLNFPTLVKKCVWSKDNVNIFCASVNGFPTHAILPNDWENNKFDSVADTFWKINTQNAKKSRIVKTEEIEEFIDGDNFFLDDDEKYLFFTNRKNGSLYRIEISIDESENKN